MALTVLVEWPMPHRMHALLGDSSIIWTHCENILSFILAACIFLLSFFSHPVSYEQAAAVAAAEASLP